MPIYSIISLSSSWFGYIVYSMSISPVERVMSWMRKHLCVTIYTSLLSWFSSLFYVCSRPRESIDKVLFIIAFCFNFIFSETYLHFNLFGCHTSHHWNWFGRVFCLVITQTRGSNDFQIWSRSELYHNHQRSPTYRHTEVLRFRFVFITIYVIEIYNIYE